MSPTIMWFAAGAVFATVTCVLFYRGQAAATRGILDATNQERDRVIAELRRATDSNETLGKELGEVRSAHARAEAMLEGEQRIGKEKLDAIKGAREELLNEFKAAAADVMEEKGKKLVELGGTTIGQTIEPLKKELAGFRQKVEEVYLAETKDRSALGKQLDILTELNGNLRHETLSLTKALKGESKTQGDWGELLLERLLESAGLVEGQHYKQQQPHTGPEGERLIPDVVILLPGARHLVVDSKVTLTAYSEYTSAESDGEREAYLKEHLDATKRHIKGLGEKNYQALYGVTGIDFVIMFMPLEGAFNSALAGDQTLFQFGWERNVLLVSPSTLLFVVRTISHLWRQEDQSRNAQDIASRGAALYDKFVAFVGDLAKIGDHLGRAQDSYADARKKLSEGSGNLVRQVELLRKLGVKPSKTLPRELISGSEEVEVDDVSHLPSGELVVDDQNPA